VSGVHSVELFSISGLDIDYTVNIEHGTTWIIREFCSYSSEGPTTLDVSELITGALLYRHTFFDSLESNAPDTQLRHLVLAALPDGADTGFIVKPHGSHWDLTVSGYILNGTYEMP
jgi:hypothetical protein